MLRRFLSGSLRFHLRLHLQTPASPLLPPAPPFSLSSVNHTSDLNFLTLRPFSTSGRDGDDGTGDIWKTLDADELKSSLFGDDTSGSDPTDKVNRPMVSDAWGDGSTDDNKVDLFADTEQEGGAGVDKHDLWSFGDETEEKARLFENLEEGEVGLEGFGGGPEEEREKKEELDEVDEAELDRREKELREILGRKRAFGDLVAESGITEGMMDSLILLKDVRHIPGLPPLRELEDRAIAKLNATSNRSEIEKRKQEEIANARVKQVDEKGRAYGTGKRKCSIARVWVQPGSGKFLVNDKEFDVYFPILDHRADLLQPFTVTDTLGRWDVNCTVKGGGVSGQVGAIRLGISRALQNFEPAYHPYLKAVGYLTRDSRVVERKKPGKAKARKSFQWVKR